MHKTQREEALELHEFSEEERLLVGYFASQFSELKMQIFHDFATTVYIFEILHVWTSELQLLNSNPKGPRRNITQDIIILH